MRRGRWFLGWLIAWGLAGSVLILPSASQAFTISSVDVIVGDQEWCSTSLACMHPIWNLGTGLVINPSERAILTQNQPTTVSATNPFAGPAGQGNFNFDTSEGLISGGTFCGTPNICNTTIRVNGTLVYTNANSVLANFNGDPGGVAHNEANDWIPDTFSGAASCGPGCEFFLGYADNAHTNACLDNGPTPGTGNCIPSDPGGNNFWDGTGGSLPTKFFLGSAVGAAPGCERPGVAPCFDAGAIQFHGVAVPQPSALLLLGGGLMGLAAWGRRWSPASSPPLKTCQTVLPAANSSLDSRGR